jgi:hypothetical protein
MLDKIAFRDVIERTREQWDHPGVRPVVRKNFSRVLLCRTPALGSEVYRSGDKEYFFHHPCKSRSCPSCGWRATLLWQEELSATLPDIRYSGIGFTMPDTLWPIFKRNRHLLHDLPPLAAEVIQQWAKNAFGLRLIVVVVTHTFGERLNFNSHLHILVSAGGLRESEGIWKPDLFFPKQLLMNLWKASVVKYLEKALSAGVIDCDGSVQDLKSVVAKESARPYWIVKIRQSMPKKHFLKYAARYARRPPVAQSRLLRIRGQNIEFLTKDRKTKLVLPTSQFIANLADHVPDHYRHAVRYFGLWSPAVKKRTSASLFLALGQKKPIPPARLSWRASVRRDFHTDPLIDENGREMHWVHRVAPTNR